MCYFHVNKDTCLLLFFEQLFQFYTNYICIKINIQNNDWIILKGDQGIQGIQGEQGDQGDQDIKGIQHHCQEYFKYQK